VKGYLRYYLANNFQGASHYSRPWSPVAGTHLVSLLGYTENNPTKAPDHGQDFCFKSI